MVTQQTLELAMKKAVEVGLLPKTAPAEIYLKNWEGMHAVLEAVEQSFAAELATPVPACEICKQYHSFSHVEPHITPIR